VSKNNTGSLPLRGILPVKRCVVETGARRCAPWKFVPRDSPPNHIPWRIAPPRVLLISKQSDTRFNQFAYIKAGCRCRATYN